MTTVIYKKLLGKYQITDISGHGEDIRVEFDDPIDAKLTVGDRVFEVERGVALIKGEIESGKILPKLYTGGVIHTLEGFFSKDGSIIAFPPDAARLTALSEAFDGICRRVDGLEAEINALKDKTERKITI